MYMTVENQNQIISEIFDMKARIVVLEEVTNDQTNTEIKLNTKQNTESKYKQEKLIPTRSLHNKS